MTLSFAGSSPRVRILSGILTVLAASSVSACRESHEDHVSYVPGGQRGDIVGSEPWPDLPCLQRNDPRLEALPHDCAAEDYEVIAGPQQGPDANGAQVCNYRITYTTERGVHCVNGRPLFTGDGEPRTAALVSNDAWSVS